MCDNKADCDEKVEEPTREDDWPKFLFFNYIQILTIYGLYLGVTKASFLTSLFCGFLIGLGVIGVTAGAHRLWAHRSYTATNSLKIFLMLCHTLVGQGSIYEWVKYHRLHHEQFCTHNDPYNPTKGFIYTHVYCFIRKPTPEQEELANKIDMSDLEQDSVVMFQKRYYWILYALIMVILPLYVPLKFWHETFICTAFIVVWMRHGLILHLSWLIYSASTVLGLKKGERYPLDTNAIFLIKKKFWLQYHYLVPWDYQTGEFGNYGVDYVSKFIRVCAALDYASDLRMIDSSGVKNALEACFKTKKNIKDCLLEENLSSSVPKDHYLRPSKFYNAS
ncbi:hypothetical protein PPYR_10906 [Photinus pyralis]|uniref:Fatty acid desaturase domain-containing protein n=1 Tax=Photinus pyralis TaxID=7054 RepID=A0A5N4AHL6_PHOPY|nr:acyl-CoA Delta(11) desaturase [Photinus pyralis]KAB0796845.1 hypothetical protein PPYR_10906 [Photinus pyralis]